MYKKIPSSFLFHLKRAPSDDLLWRTEQLVLTEQSKQARAAATLLTYFAFFYSG